MSKTKPAPLPSGTVVGGYQIIKKLAAGGFGVVYLAEDADRHLVALKEYLKTLEVEFTLGQVIQPRTFNQILGNLGEADFREEVMQQVLRTQTQAYYGPTNVGHFGLSLGSYAHFTSPIRRYADLIVHRALVSAYGLEMPKPKLKDVEPMTGLTEVAVAKLAATAEAISRTERRAMEAERETTDRYIAAYLSAHVGEIVQARITGVQNFGFFATVEGVGGDGLVPVSTLGKDYFHYDEASQTLIGEKTRQEFRPGMRLELRLAEANPVSGSLRFELPEGGSYPSNRPKHKHKAGNFEVGKRGRPKNIRHQGKRR